MAPQVRKTVSTLAATACKSAPSTSANPARAARTSGRSSMSPRTPPEPPRDNTAHKIAGILKGDSRRSTCLTAGLRSSRHAEVTSAGGHPPFSFQSIKRRTSARISTALGAPVCARAGGQCAAQDRVGPTAAAAGRSPSWRTSSPALSRALRASRQGRSQSSAASRAGRLRPAVAAHLAQVSGSVGPGCRAGHPTRTCLLQRGARGSCGPDHGTRSGVVR